MEFTKRIKMTFDRRFEKKPVIGNIVYGIFTGFAACTCMLGVFIIFAIVTGLHSTLGINYKSWHLFMMLSLFVALIAFVFRSICVLSLSKEGKQLVQKRIY
ncbi:MAG: hypothetical protein ACLUOO_10460 [Coprococcus sp.]